MHALQYRHTHTHTRTTVHTHTYTHYSTHTHARTTVHTCTHHSTHTHALQYRQTHWPYINWLQYECVANWHAIYTRSDVHNLIVYSSLTIAAKKFLYPGHSTQLDQRQSPIDHVINPQAIKQSGKHHIW